MSKQKLLPYQNEGVLELGIDEAGRGCLIGRLYVAGVILPNNIIELCDEEDIVIKDSKKMTKTNKERAREFIERNAIDYSIVYKENTYIDEHNILVATMCGMHEVVDNISITGGTDIFATYLLRLTVINITFICLGSLAKLFFI